MIRPGLVSITFRQLSAPDVCRLAADHQLEGIEWGGDVHVPVGDLDTATEVAKLTRDHGLAVAAYGSYHRLDESGADDWQKTVDTAQALGAPIIRVWCGKVGSAEADDATRQRVVEAAQHAAEVAAAAGLTIACEWHGNTLTDTAASAQTLFDAVDHPAFQTYWQPHQRMEFADCLADMETALPRLVGLHVFQWDLETVERQPLTRGQGLWPTYLRQAKTCPTLAAGGTMYAMLEFVRDDDPANLPADAKELRRWLGEINR